MENTVKNLVAHTEGYGALIEYLASNLTLFEGASASDQGVTIEEVVMDLIATQLMAVFSQNPDIEQDTRFSINARSGFGDGRSSSNIRRCMAA